MERRLQVEALQALGASPGEVDELLAYNENVFDLASLGPETRFPLPDEPFVPIWEAWAEEARRRGAFEVLRQHLPQLRFPIRAGISETGSYQAATRRGVPPEEIPEATGLPLGSPGRIELQIYQSPAGRIPLLIARGREEFATLVRALSKRNEPAPVPSSQGAQMIAGYNNWARLGELRRRWEELPPARRATETWGEELARITPHRELYQDRFILLSDGPYSAVPAADLGLDEAAWREMSLVLRRDHECAHYFTRRVFGSMRNHLLDELIADSAGIIAAIGRFRADWFLRFLGLEDFPRYRPGGRLEIYRGDLSDGAFAVLQDLACRAAESLERFDALSPAGPRSLEERALLIATLASLRLDQIASPRGVELLEEAMRRVRGSLAAPSRSGPP
jgi:hypothetical protein